MCAVFKKKFNTIAHTRKFCPHTTAHNAFTDTNCLVVVIDTELKFSSRFLRENSSITCSKSMLRSR